MGMSFATFPAAGTLGSLDTSRSWETSGRFQARIRRSTAIPEMGTPTAITKISSGNPVPAPLVQTIPSMAGYTTQPTAGNPFPSFAGHLVTVQNVMISSLITGNYGTANVSVTLTDGASQSADRFYNRRRYSLPNQNLFGTPIARGPVDVTGVIQLFSNVPELLIMSITPSVPEPASLALVVIAVGSVALRRRRDN